MTRSSLGFAVPDYEDLTGFHLSEAQLGEFLRLKSRRATNGELTHRAYVAELLELIAQAEGVFEFDSIEPNRSTARFGRQVEDTPGHALLLPDPEYIEQRLAYYREMNGDRAQRRVEHFEQHADPGEAAFEDLLEDIFAIAQKAPHMDRDEFFDTLLERLGEDPLLAYEDGAGHEGRVDFSDVYDEAYGLGIFRPDPEAMEEDDEEPGPDPELSDVAIDEATETLSASARLPEGGHVALLSTASKPLEATEYLEPDEERRPVTLSLADVEAGDALVMLFKGTEGESFDLTNTPYTVDGSFVREEVSL